MDQQGIVEAIRRIATEDPDTLALFLTGSMGRGEADEVSDVDFLAIVDDGHLQEFAVRWPESSRSICPLIFERTREFGQTILFNHITRDWIRYDLTVGSRQALDRCSQSTVRPIYDPLGLYGELPLHRLLTEPSAKVVHDTVPEFYRVLALLPVVLEREDYAVGMQGGTLLHSMLIAAFVETVTVEDRGGALYLKRLLPQNQYDIVASVPAVRATKSSVIRVHRYCAEEFTPVAHDLCVRTDVPWPEEFVTQVAKRTEPYLGRWM